MKVTRVVIRNFMPFYEEVPVNLQTDAEAPLILMGGKNDRGKTAFFMALKFCLYGFQGTNVEISDKRRHAINRRAAVEGLEETSVTIEFTHNETVYEIHRVIEFDQVEDADDRQPDDCYVTVKKPTGGQEKEVVISRGDPNRKYNEFMNGILPVSASDFFFFDGEELDRYAGSYEDSDNGVQEAIETVLGIKEIQNAISDLDDYGNDYYQDKFQEKTEDVEELQELNEEISEKQDKIEAFQTEKDSAESELEGKKERRDQLKDEIAEAAGVADSRERIKEIDEELDGAEDDDDGLRGQLKSLRHDQRELHTRVGPLMIGFGADTIQDKYDVSIVSGLEDVIEYLLEAPKCVCGHDITDDEKDVLRQNLTRVQDEEMTAILNLQELADTHLDCLTMGTDSPENLGFQQAEREYVSIQSDIDEVKDEISRLEAEREDKEEIVDDATVTAEEQEAMQAELEAVNQDIGRLQGTIDDLEEDISELESDVEDLEAQVSRKDAASDEAERYRTLMQLSDKSREAWENIKQKYVREQRESVKEHASEIFLELTNKSDVYQGLTINEDYELDVQTISGQRDVEEQQASSGARQIIAYSFIAGLNQYTAREAPVVIDTPIGRLDPEHKSNLIQHLPNFQDQVVILYQPGELSERDIEKMEDDISQQLRIHQREDDPESSDITSVESPAELGRVLAE